MNKRLRPERGDGLKRRVAAPPSESARGWGAARIEKSGHSPSPARRSRRASAAPRGTGSAAAAPAEHGLQRLQKILSSAGVASRRLSEELIAQGRVSVNGTIVTELGTKADPSRDEIKVDG